MNEKWVVFGENKNLHVERVRGVGKKFITWGDHQRGGRVNRVFVHGFFPSFEAADDARVACRYAIQRAYEAGESALIWGKNAIKESPGFSES